MSSIFTFSIIYLPNKVSRSDVPIGYFSLDFLFQTGATNLLVICRHGGWKAVWDWLCHFDQDFKTNWVWGLNIHHRLQFPPLTYSLGCLFVCISWSCHPRSDWFCPFSILTSLNFFPSNFGYLFVMTVFQSLRTSELKSCFGFDKNTNKLRVPVSLGPIGPYKRSLLLGLLPLLCDSQIQCDWVDYLLWSWFKMFWREILVGIGMFVGVSE